MERESFKECSEATIVEKEEFYAIKTCFKKLYTFLSMRGDISSEVRTEQAECHENFVDGGGVRDPFKTNHKTFLTQAHEFRPLVLL